MALPKDQSFLRLGTGPQVLEVYVDPLCPYSLKQIRGLNEHVIPHLGSGGKYASKLSVIPRPYPQPFHYSSGVVVEAILLFGAHHPEQFWAYYLAVFEAQKEWYNHAAAEKTASQIRDRLTEIALEVLDKEGKGGSGPKSQAFGDFRARLDVRKDLESNTTNEATAAMKYHMKMGRQNGIHVTPTALFDGLIDNSVSSSWGKADWDKYLSEKLGA